MRIEVARGAWAFLWKEVIPEGLPASGESTLHPESRHFPMAQSWHLGVMEMLPGPGILARGP